MITRLLWLIPVLFLGACAEFNREYAALSTFQPDAARPFQGAWAGQRTDDTEQKFDARAAITQNPDGTAKVFLETPWLGAHLSWFQTTGHILNDTQGNPRLIALSPLARCDEHNAIALAIQFEAYREGDALHIDYIIRDAYEPRSRGQMILQRTTTGKPGQ